MRFAFTDDQLLFRDTVRDLLDKECQPEQVRDAWVDDDGRLPEVWSALAEMGVLGLPVPEALGGLGLTELDLVLLLEETGRVGAARSDRRDRGGGRAAAGRGRLARAAAAVAAGAGRAATSLVTTGVRWRRSCPTRIAAGLVLAHRERSAGGGAGRASPSSNASRRSTAAAGCSRSTWDDDAGDRAGRGRRGAGRPRPCARPRRARHGGAADRPRPTRCSTSRSTT